MSSHRLAVPIFLLLLAAIFWAVIAFLSGVLDVGPRGLVPPLSPRGADLVFTPESPPALYALIAADRPWESEALRP